MSMRTIRKALGLFVVDIVIIIGIFVLQFRTDSNIIEKIGNLQVTLTKSDSENEDILLKNKMQASYNGINFYFDEQTPAYVLLRGENEKAIAQLKNWSRQEDEVIFEFDNNVRLYISLSDITEEATLIVFSELPKNVSAFYLPYNFAYNMKIQKDEGRNVVLNSKKATWNFTTDEVNDGYIVFDQNSTMAHYSIYSDIKKFTFEDLLELAAADGTNYLNIISSFKNNLITSFRASISENTFSEQAVVSYVAAMSETGKYQQAIDDIPQSYKKSDQRTYLSAPYFNNLVNMNNILEQQLKSDMNNISKAVFSESLDIFTVHNLAALLCIYPTKADVIKILQRAAEADIQNCGISQVTGIIETFDDLCSMNTDYAMILRPAITGCVNKIMSACKFENNVLTISENDTFLSVIQAVEVGIALLRYGELTNNETYIKAGRVIVSSYISESTSFDLRTLANLYPLLAYDNWYYPHFKFIRNENNQLLWAWTCAQDITASKDAEGSLNLGIKFPQSLTHYVIFKGIPDFETIYIYNMAFRTDPRFETYNSSGYVYRSSSNTLLIKSRHKSELENIRMGYKPKAAAPVKPAETTVATGSSTSSTAPKSTTPTTATTTEQVKESQNSTATNTEVTTSENPIDKTN